MYVMYVCIYCNFHPCCSLNIPSVFQVLNSSCPIDTDLAQASPGVWAGGYVSAIALWLQPCGQSIWAWPPLADCVWTTALEWKRSGCKAICLEVGLGLERGLLPITLVAEPPWKTGASRGGHVRGFCRWRNISNQLASLVPSFDPSKNDLAVYQQKVELVLAAWPKTKITELVTRVNCCRTMKRRFTWSC